MEIKRFKWTIKEQQEETELVDFPSEGFVVTIFPSQKKLVFAPKGPGQGKGLRKYIVMLKQRFRISTVNNFDDEEIESSPSDDHLRNSFEVIFDPMENFESVLSFLRDYSGDPSPENPIQQTESINLKEILVDSECPELELMKKKEFVLDLVRMMKPLDIVAALVKDLGLTPHDASRETISLLTRANEGLSSGIELGIPYPVPPSNKRDGPKLLRFKNNKIDDEVEEHFARPFGKVDLTPKYDLPKHKVPPPNREEPVEFPYDDMTIAAMKPGNRAPKRPLMNSKRSDHRYSVKKSPFKQDLDLGQPGGDGAGGAGIYRKSFHSRTGDMPGGGSSWTALGTKGWNSPPEAEFDDPEDDPTLKSRAKAKNKSEAQMAKRMVPNLSTNMGKQLMKDPYLAFKEIEAEDMAKSIKKKDAFELPGNEIEFLKSPNTGARLDKKMGNGGHSEPRVAGRRQWFRR